MKRGRNTIIEKTNDKLLTNYQKCSTIESEQLSDKAQPLI